MLSSHSIVSSSRTVRPCTPWGGRRIGQWRTIRATVCSSAPHTQATEAAISHLCKQEQKRRTSVQRRLSRIHAVLGRVIREGWAPMSGMNVRKSCSDLQPLRIPLVIRPEHALLLLSSDELMSYCCAAATNGCLYLRCRTFQQPGGHVSSEWSRCSGSMAQHAKDSVAAFRRNSAGWMPSRIDRLSAGVGRRNPVAVCKNSLMIGSMRQVWAQRHQAGAQHSAVERTMAKVAVRKVAAPAPQLESPSRL